MRSFRTLRVRRRLLAAALLLTAAAGMLLSAPWAVPGDFSDLAWTTGEPVAAPAAAAAAHRERLEFYGAARNLFSSDPLSVSPSPASPSPETPLAAPASSGSQTSTGASSSASPSEGSQPAKDAAAERGAPAKDTPTKDAPIKDAPTRDAPTKNGSVKNTFNRMDRELERLQPGEVELLTDAWLKEREREYASRRRRLKRACEAHKVGLAEATTERSVLPKRNDSSGGPMETVKATHFTVVPPHKTLTCLVNKAASTSLLGTFLKLTGHGVPVFAAELRSPHSIAKVLHPTKPGQFELAKQHYFKFMFVRHPLERLISAYEEKVVEAQHPSLLYLRKSIFTTHEDIYIRNQTYALLRSGAANRTAVLAEYEARLAEYWAEVKTRDNVPTFGEFLEFVLAREPTGDNFDSHWTPYWRQCSPCHIHYDVIGKLETGAEDFKYVWHRMKIYDKVKIPRMNSRRSNDTSLQYHAKKYLTPISDSIISKFGKMFRMDFEMFGYDWGEMLRWSGHCPSTGACSLD